MTAERPRQPSRGHGGGYLERLVLMPLVCAAFATGSGTASATYEAGSRARCDATDGETFGVDRGATRGGYETDETLQNNINSVSSGENGLVVEFNGDGDIGASTCLDDGDEMVSVTGRIDNFDEPDWC